MLSIFKKKCFFKYLNKKFGKSQFVTAFTLAEVLITIGIIGVIAAITIPALIQNTQNREFAEAAKKAYSVLQQSLLLYKNDNGGSLSSLFPTDNDSNYSINALKPYFKFIKTCTTNQICWTEPTTYLNEHNDGYGNYSASNNYLGEYHAAGVLADGMRISITNNAGNVTDSVQCDDKRDSNGNFILTDGKPTPTYCIFSNYAFIYIDTNGAKGPNKFGYDTWEFRIYDNKINGCGWGPYQGCIEDVLRTGNITKTSNL